MGILANVLRAKQLPPVMTHDVFISYSSSDKQIGDAICALLEQRNIRCWIAPRDVLPGSTWGASIVQAITESRILVLVFSAKSNRSPQVLREIERAVNRGVAILPFRVEDVMPSEGLEYFISSCHWLDAMSDPMDVHISKLADSVEALLSTPPAAAAATAKDPVTFPAKENKSPPPRKKVASRNFRTLALGAAVLLAALGWLFVTQSFQAAPPQITLREPVNNFYHLGPVLQFRWEAPDISAADAAYEIEITTVDGKTLRESVVRTSFINTTIEGALRWRVRAVFRGEQEEQFGPWSETRQGEHFRSSLRRILATGHLRVGIAGASETDIFVTKQSNNQLSGYEIELLRAIFARVFKEKNISQPLNVTYTFRPWGEQFFTLLQDDAVDLLVSAISITAAREKKYNFVFSDPTFEFPQTIVSRKGADVFHGMEISLAQVGVVQGTTNEDLLRRILGEANQTRIRLYSGPNPYHAQLADLLGKVIDGFALDKPYALALFRQFPEEASGLQLNDLLPGRYPDLQLEKIGYAVRPTDSSGLLDQINRFLRESPQEVEKIQRQYLSVPVK